MIDHIGGVSRYVECGLLTAPATHPTEARLGEIARGLAEVLDELRPTVVAIEDVFVRDNPRSALALAQARGMALAVIGLRGLVVASYPPATVKKAVAGGGRADKQQLARMVQMLVGLRSLPRADATDALAVAITHARAVEPSVAQRRARGDHAHGGDRPGGCAAAREPAERATVIARLDGVLVDRDGTHVVIDCGGVGYDVVCSLFTLAALPAIGERVVLRVFTHAMETKLTLFGFGDVGERQLFDLLITRSRTLARARRSASCRAPRRATSRR